MSRHLIKQGIKYQKMKNRSRRTELHKLSKRFLKYSGQIKEEQDCD